MGGPDEFFEAWQEGDQWEIMVSPRLPFQVFSDVLGEKAIARYFVSEDVDAL